MESETATLHSEQGMVTTVEQETESLVELGTESSVVAEQDRLMLRTEGLVKRYGKPAGSFPVPVVPFVS